jgi:hypothetical protein
LGWFYFVVWLILKIINLAFVYGEVVYDYMIHESQKKKRLYDTWSVTYITIKKDLLN